jgi:hypothetical protein
MRLASWILAALPTALTDPMLRDLPTKAEMENR